MKSRMKKLITCCCAVALMAASAIPVFAASDGWTNCQFKDFRNPTVLAVAPVSGTVSRQANGNVSNLYLTSLMWIQINEYDNGNVVTQSKTVGEGAFTLDYNYACAKNLRLRLVGGNYWPEGGYASTSGTCDFG